MKPLVTLEGSFAEFRRAVDCMGQSLTDAGFKMNSPVIAALLSLATEGLREAGYDRERCRKYYETIITLVFDTNIDKERKS